MAIREDGTTVPYSQDFPRVHIHGHNHESRLNGYNTAYHSNGQDNISYGDEENDTPLMGGGKQGQQVTFPLPVRQLVTDF